MPDTNHSHRSLQSITTGKIILSPADPTAWDDSGGRRQYDCIFMQPGHVKTVTQEPSNWLIPADVIQRDAHKFNAVPSYVDHATWFSAPSVKDLAGVTFDTRWDEKRQALVGKIRLYDEDPNSAGALVGALIDQILVDKQAGREVPPIGLSATFYHTATTDDDGLMVTTGFRHVESIDFVYDAGAGGYVRAALAAIREHDAGPAPITTGANPPKGVSSMPEEAHTSNIGGDENNTQPPPATVGAVRELPEMDLQTALATIGRVAQQVEALTGQVDRLTTVVAEQAADHTVTGMGEAPRDNGTGIRLGRTSLEQIDEAFGALLEGRRPPDGVQPLTGIRELYLLLSGDYEMTQRFYPDRVGLSNVNSSTMAGLVANRLNKVVVNIFQQYPQWWAPIVTEMDFSTLNDARWITLGGVGELPTVSEGAAYTELTWDDSTETAAFVKKGGYLGITIEAIDKDDTRRLRLAPQALAQAAWLTLSKSISNIFTSNSGVGPTMADSIALFNGSHSNLGTSALSHAVWNTTRIAMRDQTEVNSSEALGALTAPKYLLVPNELELTALQIMATEHTPGSGNYNVNPYAEGDARMARLASARERVIVMDLWTDANNWAAVADPNLYPSIGVGYRYGRMPEIFSVASPTAGLMFSNDVMPVKVRFFYATGPTDYRGLYKHNVA